MGALLKFPASGHADASAAAEGRGTPSGQSPEGQLSENQSMARSNRRTWMSAPASIAASFLPSSKARELTVESSTPSSAAYARATVSKCSMLDMPRISVSLPHKSTANLPDVVSILSGHSTGMELSTILARIDRRLAELGWSDHFASMKSGHQDAIRNIRRAIEAGRQGVSSKTLADLAKTLEIPLATLIAPNDEGKKKPPTVDELRQQREELLDQLTTIQTRIAAMEQAAAQPKHRRKKVR